MIGDDVYTPMRSAIPVVILLCLVSLGCELAFTTVEYQVCMHYFEEDPIRASSHCKAAVPYSDSLFDEPSERTRRQWDQLYSMWAVGKVLESKDDVSKLKARYSYPTWPQASNICAYTAIDRDSRSHPAYQEALRLLTQAS